MTHKPFENLPELLPELADECRKARLNAARRERRRVRKLAPGAPSLDIARRVVAWHEARAKREGK